ncbi:tetratricopeptide repeat protein, partial [Candidatus Woesearchaeota archaeon]|nr:tetratricopeptide repeat protein [Candidatus Woesearchaeota archaeon]
ADFKFSKNDFKGAEADYTKAIEVEPNNELAYAYRGIVKLTIYKDSIGSLKDFDKSIQIKPNEVAHTFRAQIYMAKKDYNNGIKDLDNAIIINPNYVDARVLRGAIRFGILHKLEGALEDYSKAIDLQPNNALYYTYRGDVRAEMGDEEGSQADYTKAEALDPNVWSLRQ